MLYTLPDGRVIDTDLIKQVSSIKDLGLDSKSIDKCVLSFSIYMKQGKTIAVCDHYHYADWAEVKKRLTDIRNFLNEFVEKEEAVR